MLISRTLLRRQTYVQLTVRDRSQDPRVLLEISFVSRLHYRVCMYGPLVDDFRGVIDISTAALDRCLCERISPHYPEVIKRSTHSFVRSHYT